MNTSGRYMLLEARKELSKNSNPLEENMPMQNKCAS